MAGPINWLSQVSAVTQFGILSMPQRRGSAAAAVFGIAGVVAVLVGVLSVAEGFRRAMSASGSPDSALVLRGGADSEMVSGFMRSSTSIIANAPGVARNKAGPLASAELFVIINLPKISTGSDVNVPLRGVERPALVVRDNLRIVEGRMFEWGKDEVIVGVGAAREFAGLKVGDQIKVGRYSWPVVGIFSASGGASESEIWSDAAVLQPAYHRGDSFQSVYVKLSSVDTFNQFKDSITTDPRLNAQVFRQTDYYAEHSTAVTKLVTTLGYLIASLMAVGGGVGARNTQLNQV
jgi:putative ABC transport system permease protein